jgi:hypothetical protein
MNECYLQIHSSTILPHHSYKGYLLGYTLAAGSRGAVQFIRLRAPLLLDYGQTNIRVFNYPLASQRVTCRSCVRWRPCQSIPQWCLSNLCKIPLSLDFLFPTTFLASRLISSFITLSVLANSLVSLAKNSQRRAGTCYGIRSSGSPSF